MTRSSSILNLTGCVILALAFIIGCAILANGGKQAGVTGTQGTESLKPLLTMQEAADYLNVTEADISRIIGTEKTMLETYGSYSGVMFPYIEINDQVMVRRDGLAEWMKSAASNRMQY